MEELLARHRTEQRDLQSRITQKKKNATKKTRKGVNNECEVLQRDLNERQQAEIAALEQPDLTDGVEDLQIGSEPDNTRADDEQNQGHQPLKEPDASHQQLSLSQPAQPVSINGTPERASKKPNRQKARLARRAAEQETQAAEAEGQAAKLPDLRQQEVQAMQEQLVKLGLTEIAIRPDGHCMYSAVATQLPNAVLQASQKDSGPSPTPYQVVRITAGDYIQAHSDEFVAFLEEPLDVYVGKIRVTAEWGGQLELQALARAYGININVLQADGRVERVESGSPTDQDPIWLAYYRHSFGLGEHYNALKKLD